MSLWATAGHPGNQSVRRLSSPARSSGCRAAHDRQITLLVLRASYRLTQFDPAQPASYVEPIVLGVLPAYAEMNLASGMVRLTACQASGPRWTRTTYLRDSWP
jgi:hypothetical protein